MKEKRHNNTRTTEVMFIVVARELHDFQHYNVNNGTSVYSPSVKFRLSVQPKVYFNRAIRLIAM